MAEQSDRADSPDLDPDFTPQENIEADHRGSIMFEYESYERVVEGLKLASDGARNMARFNEPDLWNPLAQFFDSLRKAIVQLAGLDRGADTRESSQQWGGTGVTRSDAMSRISNGLKGAASAANQIAQVQRKDPRWLRYAIQIDRLRDKSQQLALAGSPLLVDSGWARRH
ncbi:MAG TPA: hypothetical protein VHY10_16295 [Xanthobacteraceae bacterium]|nr:hypothetical protein [Xanthobacteraceae bacterium]